MKKTLENLDVIVLNQISHVLVHQKNITLLLKEVLDILNREMKLKSCTFSLKHGSTLIIEESCGLTNKEQERGKYKMGEGITGKVASKGKSIVIPNVADEPLFLDKTKSRENNNKISFICVPIKTKNNVIATLSIDKNQDLNSNRTLEMDKYLLETIANILADAIDTIHKEVEEKYLLLQENQRLRQELDHNFRPINIIGNCNNMRALYRMIAQVSESSATVLIRGESGTGKELVARAIHNASPRKKKKFIAVNCAALPENLVESELFGHEKGSFTGAHALRKGRCELANGGTLFLDEIGDISLAVQVKLLRFLQEKTFERVGGSESINVDVRVLAATSRDLEKHIEEEAFREDLFYRLNVFPIHMPALRERKSDIMLLTDAFLAKYNSMYDKNIKRISTPAINMLMAYHWPGNVRELENCIERSVLTSTDDVIHGYNLPPSLQVSLNSDAKFILNNENATSFSTLVDSYERELIIDALKSNHGIAKSAAKNLQLTQRIINYKIKHLNINPKKYR